MKKSINKFPTVFLLIASCHLLGFNPFGTSYILHAQDIHLSQFWMAPLLQNPAFAGANHDMQAILNYKNQWNSVASPYKTGNVSFDMKLNRKKATKGFLAAGINIFSDKAGDGQMGTTQANLSLAYHVNLNAKNTFGGGLMGGFGQRSINSANLQWMNQYDGTSYNASLASGEPSISNSITYADFGSGVLWSYNKGEGSIASNDQLKATAGIAVFHPQQPKYSYSSSGEKLDMKTVIHGNLLYGIKNTNISLVPGFMFYKQGSAQELLAGSMVRYTLKEESKITGYVKGSAISLGAYYRNKDAVIATMLFEIAQYAIGISYDVNVSQLKTASNGKGGFEISLRFINPSPFKAKTASRI